MKKYLLVFVAVIFLLISCSKGEEGALGIRGTITSISTNEEALWLLVEGEISEDTIYETASITIDDKTKIVDDNGKSLNKDDIKEGQLVEVWIVGPVAESYPVQANASKVVIKEIQEAVDEKKVDLKNEAILAFAPVLSHELISNNPKEGFGYIDTMEIEGDDGAYLVHLYNDLDVQDNLIYAYIEYNGITYELGEVSAYGIEDIEVSAKDITMNDKLEAIIRGGMGATYIQTLVIGRDQDDKLILLLEGPFETIDLDKDGIEEWAAVSFGSLPPYLDIYRWNGSGFEMASIMEALGTNFAYYHEENNEYFIESGIYAPDDGTVLARYKYNDGKLVRVD